MHTNLFAGKYGNMELIKLINLYTLFIYIQYFIQKYSTD